MEVLILTVAFLVLSVLMIGLPHIYEPRRPYRAPMPGSPYDRLPRETSGLEGGEEQT